MSALYLPPGCDRLGDLYAGAVFSPDTLGPDGLGMYRYVLWRRWDDEPGGIVLVVMLNPSTATHEKLDNTISGIFKRTRIWNDAALGCNGHLPYREIRVCNLYGLRSTDPHALKHVADPVGPYNDRVLETEIAAAQIVICGWGRNAKAPRVAAFGEIVRRLGATDKIRCFRKLADGMPEHPLYVPHALPLEIWP